MEEYIKKGINMAIEYIPNVIMAILILVIGIAVIGGLVKMTKKAMKKADLDETLRDFLGSIIGAILKVALILAIASQLGVEATSFVAILGAAGLAIGLALQGTLSNFAGSVLLMLFKPYKKGDFIEAQGHMGTVHEIQIFNTILKTPDNKTILIPNGPMAGGNIVNFSTEATRRVDMSFGISYGDDIDKAKATLHSIINADERIMQDPKPFVVVGALADSSVNFTVRVWAKSSDYWAVFFDMQENVKKTFDKENISIPFPQRDVHLHQVGQ